LLAISILLFHLSAKSDRLLVAGDADKPAGDMTIVVRDDGKKMWAYKGKPLYTFKKDTAPGDIHGDGFLNGAWHLATP
jgi:predicted lipoprotein with Yx(FWY)xxD motif